MPTKKKTKPAGKAMSTKQPDTDLTIRGVGVNDRGLYLRQGMADGDFTTEDGRKCAVECAVCMSGGAVVVTVTPENSEPAFWRTYEFNTGSLIRAAVEEYLRNPPARGKP